VWVCASVSTKINDPLYTKLKKYEHVHPVAERHLRIQALMSFTRNIMKRTWLPMHERDEMIENYCRKHWGLSQNAIRDYRKTALAIVQYEIESLADNQIPQIST